MKLRTTFWLALILSSGLWAASPALANLGESFTQINARYGKPVRKLPLSMTPDPAQSIYRYEFNGRKIYITFIEGKSVSEAIRAPEQDPRFPDKTCLAMTALISGQRNWTETSRDAGGILWVTGGLTAILKKNTSTPDFFTVSTLKYDAREALVEQAITPGVGAGATPGNAGQGMASSGSAGEEICKAVRDGDLEKVKALLKSNPALASSQNRDGQTPLHCAALRCEKQMVRLLLDNKADVNARNAFESTPLDAAAAEGCTDVAALLIANKADVNAKNVFGNTPLLSAAGSSKPESTNVVALLLTSHADINARASAGESVLHTVGTKEMAAFLLAHGAGVDARTLGLDTPLHFAAMFGKKDLVELFLANKPDVNAKDNGGVTPLGWALQQKHNDVAELLRQHGGH